MVINCNSMRWKKEQLQKELDKIYSMEKRFPKGELRCSKNNSRYKWYVKNQAETIYLSKNEREMAEKLAVKKYYTYKKQELESALDACNAYLKKMQSIEGKAEQLMYHPEYRRLLEKQFMPVNEELKEWQNAPYERCNKHEESRIIKGTQGKMLRSKSEAIIDMLLYKYQIPFHYEERLDLNGFEMYPDFTIRHPMTGETMYWEHFGLMDNEIYRNNVYQKMKRYCENGIIPSINLIATYETNDHPLNIEYIESIIKIYFL